MQDVTAVITCMTDAERPFIRATLASVQAQTVPCDVILLVTEANAWIEPILAEFPGVRLLRMPLAPLGVVRNTGVAAATTEFVAFLDGDDVWMPEKTARQLAQMRRRKADFVGVDHMLMTEEGRIFAHALARYLPMPSSWMVRRELMLQHPFTDAPLDEDGIWWRGTHGQCVRVRLPEPLIGYRVRNASLSSVTPSKRRKLFFAKLSTLPAMRPLLMAATWVLHAADRRTLYRFHPAWAKPDAGERRILDPRQYLGGMDQLRTR